MYVARRVLCGAWLAVVVCAGSGCQPDGLSGVPPNGKLAHFEGSIDTSKYTYDKARSDLYVRAARALEKGDAAGAETLYREGVARYPEDPAAYAALAACLFFQARYADSRAEYGKALERDPRCTAALYGLGCIAYKERHYGQARDHLLRALQSHEDHGGTHRMLVLVYEQLGDRAAAQRHRERAAALNTPIR